jgi:hypothetical protein
MEETQADPTAGPPPTNSTIRTAKNCAIGREGMRETLVKIGKED